MYIFSVNATAKKDMDDIQAGETMPFIVYINFKDLFGAEQLCKLYLMNAGFTDITIGKRKYLTEDQWRDKPMAQQDKALREALETGYCVQLFEAH